MLRASDIMNPNVMTIRSAATVQEAIDLMREEGLQALVVNRRHPQDAYGILTDTDIVSKVINRGRSPEAIRVLEIMTKPCITINPDLGLDYVARLLVNSQVRQAPVIQQELLGIISYADLLEYSHRFTHTKMQLDDALEVAIDQARATCSQTGHGSNLCAEAWKAVEELQAEVAYLRLERLERTAFDLYCDDFPDAIATKEYDAWCSG
ncbi:CBS domain-containing protein [Lyngbya confervoides]|uniref:CBS domain-containing protein n=1 Tax=Lyngbya confervoides BDU141951 TaxID=1574623 RepID=A0ABD4T1P7_9CYAN|nr:CBS domain-containing protein [Lyngbya confervoides]MCM1982569.1 CBS domain-containing protein [Lyngbya confervoides BDU141951]